MRHLIVHTACSQPIMNEFQSFQIGSISDHCVWCHSKIFILPFIHELEAAGEYHSLQKGNSNTASSILLIVPVSTPQSFYDSSKTGFIVFIKEQVCQILIITPLRSHPQVIRAALDKHSLQQNNTFCREKCLSTKSDEIFLRHKSHQC